MTTTMAVAGASTASTGRSRAPVTNGLVELWRRACTRMATEVVSMATASQNGKKPLSGPSLPQPMPRRSTSTMTMTLTRISVSAVTRSAARIALLLQQSALLHQITMERLGLGQPLDVLVAGRERGLERALVHVLPPLRGLRHLL